MEPQGRGMECSNEHSQTTSRNEAQPCSGNITEHSALGWGLEKAMGKKDPQVLLPALGTAASEGKGWGPNTELAVDAASLCLQDNEQHRCPEPGHPSVTQLLGTGPEEAHSPQLCFCAGFLGWPGTF